jgi:hypothetical protein
MNACIFKFIARCLLCFKLDSDIISTVVCTLLSIDKFYVRFGWSLEY